MPRVTDMTLRDWFAGQALTSLLQQINAFHDMNWARVASTAYAIADAMMEERDKDDADDVEG